MPLKRPNPALHLTRPRCLFCIAPWDVAGPVSLVVRPPEALVMAAWHRRYNVSGTVHCGGRVEDWCRVLRSVLQTDQVGAIGHFTGAVSVFASSPVADVVSCGFEVHEFWALAPGERADWVRFAAALEAALGAAELPYSLVVHEGVLVRE